MPDAMRRQVYSQLSFYAMKDGRMQVATHPHATYAGMISRIALL